MTADQELCLQYTRELKDEIRTAILAISEDCLDALEESLWRQQVLCVSLRRLLDTPLALSAEAHQAAEIHNATASLQELNKIYTALVRQSRSSCELLSKLCLAYAETSGENLLHQSDSRSPRGFTCTV